MLILQVCYFCLVGWYFIFIFLKDVTIRLMKIAVSSDKLKVKLIFQSAEGDIYSSVKTGRFMFPFLKDIKESLVKHTHTHTHHGLLLDHCS